MMKSFKSIAGALITAALITAPAFGATTNFSQYTTQQLANMRNSIQTMSVQERKAFMQEWQKRLQAMTPQERKKYEQQMMQMKNKVQAQGTQAANSMKNGQQIKNKDKTMTQNQEQDQQMLIKNKIRSRTHIHHMQSHNMLHRSPHRGLR